MPPVPSYPTDAHARAAHAIADFFAARDKTDAVLLVNSCARGKATRDSCLDIKVLVPAGMDASELETDWERHRASAPVFGALERVGVFSDIHLDIEDGTYDPDPHPKDEYPDFFEVRIGNALVYSVRLWERGDRLAHLRQRWLPYYEEHLRHARLAEVRWCCQHYLEHIPPYVERGPYFQSFARLWGAFQMFLQALFIAHRTYPIAYDKWIHEQVVELLGLPDLYLHLPPLFEIERFESAALVGKARDLQRLLDTWVEG